MARTCANNVGIAPLRGRRLGEVKERQHNVRHDGVMVLSRGGDWLVSKQGHLSGGIVQRPSQSKRRGQSGRGAGRRE
jgi:hypothetical protein